MCYKSSISKTEKKKNQREENKLGHIILSVTQAQQNLEPWISQFHLSALCSPLWSHGPSLGLLRHLHPQYLDVCLLLLGCFNVIP